MRRRRRAVHANRRGLAPRAPDAYDLLVFTTGPLFNSRLISALLNSFPHCRQWAVNVSVVDDAMRDRFDVVLERDSTETTRADLSWTVPTETAPVVGLAFAPPQHEYSEGRHDAVRTAVQDWAGREQLATMLLDMDMYADHRYRRTPAQVAALIGRVDVVVSMRLHAAVLALVRGTPTIAVDPIPGGGKVSRQMRSVGWPCVLPADRCTPEALNRALDWCSSEAALAQVQDSRVRALADVAVTGGQFRAAARDLVGEMAAGPDARAS